MIKKIKKNKLLLSLGEVTFSNGFPVSIECRESICYKEIKRKQEDLSLELGMPVVILKLLTGLGNKEQWHYQLLHKDSVISRRDTRKNWFGKFQTTPILSDSPDDNFEVLGLWDGNCISDLLELFTVKNFDKKEVCIIALQSQRIHKKKLKNNEIGIKEVRLVPYFLDRKGNGLINYGKVELFNSRKWKFLIVATNSISDLLMSIKDYLHMGCNFGNREVDLMSWPYKEYKSRAQNLNDWNNVDKSKLATIDITPSIKNISTEIERDMLRVFFDHCGNSFYCHEIGLSIVDTHNYILNLVDRDLLEFSGDDHVIGSEYEHAFPYNLVASSNGRRIGLKSLTKRMKRKTVERLLATVIERAEEAENLRFLKYRVDSISVFGSYLDSTKESYGDLDLVVMLVEKSHKDFIQAGQSSVKLSVKDDGYYQLKYDSIMLRSAEAWNMHDKNVINYKPKKMVHCKEYIWDLTATKHHLKRGNHNISMHSESEFSGLKTNDIVEVYKFTG